MKRVLPRLRFDGETFGRGPIVADRLLVDPLPPVVSRYQHASGYPACHLGTGRRKRMVSLADMAESMGHKVHDFWPNRAARRAS